MRTFACSGYDFKIIKQRLGKLSRNGSRVYIEDPKLADLNLIPGKKYGIKIDKKNNLVSIIPGVDGNIVIPRIKNGKQIPVIDKKGSKIKEALCECDYIKVTFIKDELVGDRVIIQGFKNTSNTIKNAPMQKDKKPTCITFSSGSGISSIAHKSAGFNEILAVEYNPQKGSTSRYSDIYEVNNPDVVMFNIPIQLLDANDLPAADVWFMTLPCNEFSKMKKNRTNQSKNKKQDYSRSLHLYMYAMSLFWQLPKIRRPKMLLLENVPPFASHAGECIKLCLEDEGYHVEIAKLNSISYGARTNRERMFLVASIYEGFSFPAPTGSKDTPIIEDGVITLDSLTWFTPEDNASLKYYLERDGKTKHNHKIKTYDITQDTHISTVTKTSSSMKPENILKHPYKEDTYSVVQSEDHLKYLHGIPNDYHVGDSKTLATECIGQGVDLHVYSAIVNHMYQHLIQKFNDCCMSGDSNTSWEQLELPLVI